MNFKIQNRTVGDGYPVFIVAELSCNHLQKFDLAKQTIKMMKKASADAIKLQTYTPDTITINIDNKYFKIRQGTVWDNKIFYKLYEEAYMPWEWQPKLKKYAEELGLICFSSPFDKTAVDFLEKINVPAYKVASFEINDISLIEYIASKGKPILVSTGIAKLNEITEVLKICKRVGNNQIALLKCTSSYPANTDELNLITIKDMKERFKTLVGFSDHSLDLTVPAVAVALGARIVEKHFILDRKMGGPDASFSLEPEEFKKMVDTIRNTEKALGKVSYLLTKKIKINRQFSRSLFVVEDIKKGQKFTLDNVRSIRPNFGLAPKYLFQVIGKLASKNIKKGTPLKWSLIKSKKNL